MTVKELISRLEYLPSEALVMIELPELRAGDQGNYPLKDLILNSDGEIVLEADS